MAKPLTENLTVVNKLGFHARAAAKFVKLAVQFKSDISLSVDGTQANGKSIMGILLLAAGKGKVVTLTVFGVDQDTAFAELKKMVLDGFGEEC
jgi:phosphocarrier protein